jgi:hypothetical protein
MTTLTVLGAAIAYLIQNENFTSQTREIWFYCSILGAGSAWALAVYCIARSFWGYTYQKLPRLSKLNSYFSELEAYFQQYPDQSSNAEEQFARYLTIRLSEATDHNAENNLRKSFWFNHASIATAVSLLLTATAGLQFLFL